MGFLGWTWQFIVWTFEAFIFFATLMLLIWIFIDIFRDHKLKGGWKAVWIIVLVFLPLLGALIYVIARGRGMAERSAIHNARPTAREDDAYKPAASASPAEDIARAQKLLESGAISQGEFDAIKSKALGNQYFG